MSNDNPQRPPLNLSAWQAVPGLMMLVGGVLSAFGCFYNPAEFGFSWLFAFIFFYSIALGALFLVLVHHLTDAGWSVGIRRFCEHLASLMGWQMVALFLPVAALAPHIYAWMSVPATEHLIAAKAPVFTKVGFYAVSAAFLAIFWFLTSRLSRLSLQQDLTGAAALTHKMRFHAGWGIVAFASSLDQAGPMAHTVRDCAIMLEAMAGFDPKDATSLDLPVPAWEAGLSADLRGKKVGIPREYRLDGLNAEVAKSWDEGVAWLKDAGAEVVEISLPHTKYALPTYYIIAPAEASSNLARYDGVRYGLRDLPQGAGLQDMYAATRAAGFGSEVKRRILMGTYVLSAGFYDAYYTQAQKVRTLISRDFAAAFATCDIILAPTAPSSAFALGEKSDDPLEMYLNDVFSVPASLAGLPAMSVPSGLDSSGLPLGLQLIGKPFDEQGVLNAGLAIEARANFSARPGKWW